MSLRDDFGSNAGTSRGYGGGGYSGRAGGLGNGGVGGGMGGGMMGGGAARNGGIGSRTGMGTGKTMYGGMAMGRPGGPAMNPGAWGVRHNPNAVAHSALTRPARPPGLLGNPTPVSAIPNERILAVEDVPPYTPNVFNQNYLNSIVDFRNAMSQKYGWSGANVTPGPGPVPQAAPDALANDLTRFASPNAKPMDFYAGQGGLGVPGFSTTRDPYNKTPGFGDNNYSPRGFSGGGRGGSGGGW
jgi:hypothetical protein